MDGRDRIYVPMSKRRRRRAPANYKNEKKVSDKRVTEPSELRRIPLGTNHEKGNYIKREWIHGKHNQISNQDIINENIVVI